MLPRGPFDDSKHPRGWHGRFSGGAGRSSEAGVTRGTARPARPHPIKRLHAVVPVKGASAMSRPGSSGVGFGGGLGAASSGLGRMAGD